jgi:hypothetical protein
MVVRSALFGALLFTASILGAQPLVVGAEPQLALRAGTAVPMRLLEELTTNGERLRAGDRFNLETTDAVSVNGQVVIPIGSHAVGEVNSIRNKGMWGKSGNIEARVLFVTANGRNIRLSGSLNDKGTTGTAGVIGAIAFLPVAGFFVTGTSAVIHSGAQVHAFIDEDVAVAFASDAVPQPMVVGTSAIAPGVSSPGAAVLSGVMIVRAPSGQGATAASLTPAPPYQYPASPIINIATIPAPHK